MFTKIPGKLCDKQLESFITKVYVYKDLGKLYDKQLERFTTKACLQVQALWNLQ